MYWCRDYPPLHLATRHGHAAIVSLLLRWGAEQTPLIQTGEFPIHIAAREGHAHLIELFCSLDNKWVNCKTEKPKLQ
ncbi:hypothetical protein HELRODRAFT_85404, partial [Helobdella robusta]|uniref:Uncharacterized protein n=1 Tax=Helobdella robusta TaxID=6412 RepID=T1G5W6_HELRO